MSKHIKIQAPDQLKHFIRDQVIQKLNWQRNDLITDQFAAVVLSDKDLSHINELRLGKGNLHP